MTVATSLHGDASSEGLAEGPPEGVSPELARGIACIGAALASPAVADAAQAAALPARLATRASTWLATLGEAPADAVIDPALAARVVGRLRVDPDATVADLLAVGSGLAPWTVAPDRGAAAAGAPLDPGLSGALLERTSRARSASARAPRLIPALFAEQAVTHAARCAVDAADGTVTFAELERRTRALAQQLLERGVGPDSVVAVVASRETVLIEALLAIWRAGAAFLLLDPHDPHELSRYKLEAAAARLVVCAAAHAAAWQALPRPVMILGPTASAAGGADRPLPAVDGQQLAYVVFTSGSTGQPKGVMIDHAGLAEHLATQVAPPYDAVAAPDVALRVGGAAPVSFDSFIDQVLPMVALGHTLVLFGEDERVTPARYLACDASAVDVVDCAPSQLTVLVEHGLLERQRPLRLIVFGGESPNQHTWQRVRASGVPAISIYGATECTIGSMAADVHESECVTLGYPDGSARIYLLDEEGHALPPGVVGEICLAGPGVGRGYVGAPDETAARFVPDPFSQRAGARMYRTGDLGRMDSSGRLYFCGRRDDQVKIRGFRIELGEVEAVLTSAEGVRQAAVLPVPSCGVATHLAAYLVGAPNLDWPRIRAEIARRLPAHMIPARALQLEALPLTRNGKVDRRALAALDASSAPAGVAAEETHSAAPPASELEAWVRDIWQAVLKQDQLGVLDNFVDIGGHSLAMMDIMTQIQQGFPHHFDVRAALAAQTVREMASVLAQASNSLGEARAC